MNARFIPRRTLSQRKAYGLPSDKDLVVKLMTASEAQRQVSTYGVVLTQEEERAYATKADAMDDLSAVMTVAEDLTSYAGAIVQDDEEPYILQVFLGGNDEARAADEERLETVVDDLVGPLDVSIEERRFSIRDLTMIGSLLSSGDVPVELDKGRALEALESVAKQNLPSGTLFGYSMRDGDLTAQLPVGFSGDRYMDFALGEDLPDVQIIATKSAQTDWGVEDQGSAACGRFWCGAPKGGHITRFKSGGEYFRCSWAGGIRVKPNGTSVWKNTLLTAGHCGSTSHDETFYNYQNEGSSTVPGIHFGIVNTSASNDTVGQEWRNSLERSGDSWGDFSLVSAASTHLTNLILTGNTTTARVTTLTPVPVGLNVCISARSTGVKCDEVDNNGWVWTLHGKQVTHLAVTRGSYNAVGGDSGSTMFVQGSPHQLVGSHSGEKTNWANQTYQVFSRVTLVDNSPNMSITNIAPVPTDGRRDFIAGMYTRNLNRLPDLAGYNHWRNTVMSSCTVQTARITAESFMKSVEFRNRFPVASGTNYERKENAKLRVHYAFRTYFGRDPDGAGFNHWYGTVMVDGIDNGAGESAWNNLVWSFANSGEFTNRVNGPTALADGAICA